MRKALLAPVAGAVLLAAGATIAQAQTMPCSDSVGMYLQQHGIDASKLSNVTVQTQRWDHRGGSDNGPIYGYTVQATPAQCSSGALQMALTVGCEVSHVATTPGCSIKGIPSVWW